MLLECLAFKWGFYARERLPVEQLPINFGISCEHYAKITWFYTFIHWFFTICKKDLSLDLFYSEIIHCKYLIHGQIGESLSDCRYAVFFAESWQKSTSHHNWQWNCEFSTKSKCPINYCSLRTLLILKKKKWGVEFFLFYNRYDKGQDLS